MIPLVKIDQTKYRANYKKLIANIKSIPTPVSIKDFTESSKLRQLLGKSAQEQIDSKGRRGGKQYAGYLLRAKKGQRRQRTSEPATLKKTGAMYDDLRSGRPFRIKTSARSRVINIELDNKIALFHQRGTSRLVIRRVFAPNRQDAIAITKELQEIIERAIQIGLAE